LLGWPFKDTASLQPPREEFIPGSGSEDSESDSEEEPSIEPFYTEQEK